MSTSGSRETTSAASPTGSGASATGPSGLDAKASDTGKPEPALPLVVVDRHSVPAASRRSAAVKGALRKVRWLPLIPVIMLTGGVIAMYFQPPGIRVAMRALGLQPGGGTSNPIAVPAPAKVEMEPGAERATRRVVALARLVPQDEIRTVAPPSGAGDARIAALKVEEGTRVESGTIVAVLDNEGQLIAALNSAKANVAARSATLEQVRAQVRASREEAQAGLSRAQSTARNAQLEFERVEQLAARGISSEATLSKSRTARDETAREVDRARATLSRYQSVELDQQPDVVVAASNLAVANSDLARATQDLDKAYVRAPIGGTVLSVLVRAGEKPGAAGIVKIGDLTRMKAEIEVYQNQIGFVSVGDEVEITADSLPRRLDAVVERIGLEVGRQTLVDPTPAANTDARVVKVHALLSPESTTIAQRYTNLQLIARITTRARP